ncbi:hypothetical protein [Paenibacillus sp. NPDC058174]
MKARPALLLRKSGPIWHRSCEAGGWPFITGKKPKGAKNNGINA